MSTTTPKKKPAANDTARTFDLPEIFWREDDDAAPAALREPVELVYVKRVTRQGEADLATMTLEQIPTRDHVRTHFGAGVYKLVGRSARGSILARTVLTLASVDGSAPMEAAEPGAVAAPRAPTVDPFVGTLLTAVTNLAAALATAGEKSQATILQAVTSLAGTRITDQKELFHTLLAAKGPKGGAGGELQAFKAGTEFIQELLDKAGVGGDDGTTPEQSSIGQLKELFQAMKEFKALQGGTGRANDGTAAAE